MIRNIPVPAAGVMLGLAALGHLLAPYGLPLKYLCGVCALFLGLLLLARAARYPRELLQDLNGSSVLGSVAATFFMAWMQLAAYLAPFAPAAGHTLWLAAAAGHTALMGWFTARYLRRPALREVFPTYFIAYVGLIAASVTAPAFGEEALGAWIFRFGFAAYLALFVLVTVRYLKERDIPEPARPLFCIYAAPMSLSLAGYLACMPEKSTEAVLLMAGLAQIFYAVVIARLPGLLRLPFYPSYAAFTFPCVISAAALRQALLHLDGAGVAVPALYHTLAEVETAVAAAVVFYVFARYLRFLFGDALRALRTRAALVRTDR